MSKYTRDDVIREFESAKDACQSYFNYMYKVLQFSFAAIIATIVAATQLFNVKDPNIEYIKAIVLAYILPISTYIFGVMYAYNAYALTVCGKQAELLHNEIYSFDKIESKENDACKDVENFPQIGKYIVTDRKITFWSYGLQLMFYVCFPLSSDIFSLILSNPPKYIFFYKVLPFIMTALYLGIMSIIIYGIVKDFFIDKKFSDVVKEIMKMLKELLIKSINKVLHKSKENIGKSEQQ